jgi:hypothetical protein
MESADRSMDKEEKPMKDWLEIKKYSHSEGWLLFLNRLS